MYTVAERTALAEEFTRAFLSGPWTVEGIAESGAGCLDRWPSWMTRLAMSVLAAHRIPPSDRRWELHALVSTFLDGVSPDPDAEPPQLLSWSTRPSSVPAKIDAPKRSPFKHAWPIAELVSVPALAERLELSDGQLAWLADVRGLERRVTSEQLRNYRYRTLPRPSGMPRVIEAPKARLKEIQRWVLAEILDHVPTHRAAHGFTAQRSVITHAEIHTGQAAVLRIDLKDFFASVTAGRVYGLWRTLGYSPSVSHTLTGLSTNTVPQVVWQVIAADTPERAVQERFQLGRSLATPHLPQGAPTSPSLANLAAFRLDRRLCGLAAASGLRYSRYADDLTFSGSERLHRRRAEFAATVSDIVRAEGFAVHPDKTVIQGDGGRQTVCGVVVNVRTNLRRQDYDRLKAILHNAVVHGPAGQNREGVPDFRAHLGGRISWVRSLNPERGRKLQSLFTQIDWS